MTHISKKFLSLLLIINCSLTGCSQIISQTMSGMQKNQPKEVLNETPVLTREELGLRPEDDFYGYYGYDRLMSWKLGKYSQYSSFTEAGDQIEQEQNQILDEVLADGQVWQKGTPEATLTTAYQLIMDMEDRDREGTVALQPAIQAITEATDINSYVQACGLCYRAYGIWVGMPFSIGPSVRQQANELMFGQPDFGVPVKELTGDDSATMVMSIQNMISMKLRPWGSDRVASMQEGRDTAELLAQIAASSMDEDTFNQFFDYEYLSLEEFQVLFPDVDIPSMLKAYELEQVKTITLLDRGSAEAFGELFTEEHLQEWKTYALYEIYNRVSEYCDSPHRNPAVGGEARKPDELLARDMLKSLYPEELGYLWMKRYVPEGTKEYATQMVADIKAEMRRHIEALTWMSDETKKGALKKLDQMKTLVAYPDEWKNGFSSDNYVMKSKESGGQFLTEIIQYILHDQKESRDQLSGYVEHSSWGTTASNVAQVNCFYNPQENSIFILSGMLREPFFQLSSSYEQNLGGIGMVIGHEITHGFDSNGSRFDADGLYHNWWTETDRTYFDRECDKIADYYDTYGILNIYHVDGRKTLTENIADLGGISLISDICPAQRESRKQMYEAYVNVWMTLQAETGLVDALKTDIHSPAEARINGVLSNTDQFYDTFDLTPEDKMYIPKEKRVGIW